jgi:hypothetical protein
MCSGFSVQYFISTQGLVNLVVLELGHFEDGCMDASLTSLILNKKRDPCQAVVCMTRRESVVAVPIADFLRYEHGQFDDAS